MGKRSFWTDYELDLLKANYLKKTKEGLCELLPNRTWKSIRDMANKLGLKRSNNYKDIPINERYKKVDNSTYKKCKSCRRYLPFNLLYFPKDKTCNDGYRNICKECKGENFAISDNCSWTDEQNETFIREYPYHTNNELIQKFFPDKMLIQLQRKADTLNREKGLSLYKTEEVYKKTCKDRMNGEVREKLSRAKEGMYKGNKNPMYGVKRFGELNPNWKGGRRTEKEIFMASDECKKWRKEVFERDNYTCQCCGSRKSNMLEAHHRENYANNPELRLDVSNGITLCKKCHNPNQKGSFHNIYGTINNNGKQLREYIGKYKVKNSYMKM
ncbi:hypothetical protein SDC9_81086 [bioreactor metagenome]|uniref:HNH nuclease domain-containing protein n=1 Tax=bioreactor metagenome TaxID=1076179 RepID=A0A644Z714_9ZZZZ